jgi:hypothetical protein
VLRADQKREGLLYCGTEYGMYASYDGGNNWKRLQLNLPLTPITDMCIKDNSLVVATQGRSFWVLDDLLPIQNFSTEPTKMNFHLYEIADSYRVDGWQNKNARNAGMNPPNGVVVPFWLNLPTDTVTVKLSVLNAEGKIITEFSNKATGKQDKLTVKKGMNEFVWNTFLAEVEPIDGMILWNGSISGPRIPPGKYLIRMTVGKEEQTQEFLFKANPTYKCTEEEYKAQYEFLMEVKTEFSDVQQCIRDIRTLRGQIEQFKSLSGKQVSKEITAQCDSVLKKIGNIEAELYQVKLKSGQDILNYPMKINDRLAGLYNYASSGNTAPNNQVKEAFSELKKLSESQLNSFREVMDKEVIELNRMIKTSALPVIGLPEKEKK